MALKEWIERWREDTRNRLVMVEPLYSYTSKAYLLPVAVILAKHI